MTDDRAFLRMLFDSAVAASKPAACMPRWLEDRPNGNVLVVGAGNSAVESALGTNTGSAPPRPGPKSCASVVPVSTSVFRIAPWRFGPSGLSSAV